jgi:hypothetical protein
MDVPAADAYPLPPVLRGKVEMTLLSAPPLPDPPGATTPHLALPGALE